MRVKLWGVRGSTPVPGPSTARYGGNTPCVSVENGTESILVLDSGTGIRELGKTLAGDDRNIYVLLTHDHWDHVQGFPFFGPIYQPKRNIWLFPTVWRKRILHTLLEQMDGAHFPVTPDSLPSRHDYVVESPMEFLCEHGFTISRIATNHPGGCYGYRIVHQGRIIVYIPDNELHPPGEKVTEPDEFVRFCRNADVLIHDSQYLEEDMPDKHGWGHSVVGQVLQLSAAAAVKRLILFHHDPDRTDDALDGVGENARRWLKKNHHDVQCTVGYEGLSIDL